MANLKGTTYPTLDNLLGARFDCKIGNNTHCHRDGDGLLITLHGNDIVRLYADRVEFTLAGWNTVTTRERVNQFLPRGVGVTTRNYVPLLSRWDVDGDYRERDVIELNENGWYTVEIN